MSNGSQLLSNCSSTPCGCKPPKQPGGNGGGGTPGSPLGWITINQIQWVTDIYNVASTAVCGSMTFKQVQQTATSPVNIVQSGAFGTLGSTFFSWPAPYTWGIEYLSAHCWTDVTQVGAVACDPPAAPITTGPLSDGSDPVGDSNSIAVAGQAAIDQAYTTLGATPP